MIVADRDVTLMLSGQGDVIEPADGVCTIGSGGTAARQPPASDSYGNGFQRDLHGLLEVAAEICIYTNHSVVLETLAPPCRPCRYPVPLPMSYPWQVC